MSCPMLAWYKSITNRRDKKWECDGKKWKRGIDAEERIGVTTKTIFFVPALQLEGTLSLPRDWEFFSKVWYQLAQDFFSGNFISFWVEESMVLLAWSIIDGEGEKEMVQKENNILIDETRTDLRQGFHRIHSSSSFLPHLSFHLQDQYRFFYQKDLSLINTYQYLKRNPLLWPKLFELKKKTSNFLTSM